MQNTHKPARDAIIEATSALLETQGYHGTGLNQIIQESGAPRGSLYYYFPEGKEELAAAAIAQRAEAFAAFLAGELGQRPDAREAVLYLLDQMIAHFESNAFCGGAPMAAVALETAATSPRLRAACAAAYAAIHAPFVDKLAAAGYPPERAASLATLINAALEGAVVQMRSMRSTLPLLHVRAELDQLLTRNTPAAP